ncbi:helix-turn-helix domain-containing protein [Streptomyces sp. SBR177]
MDPRRQRVHVGRHHQRAGPDPGLHRGGPRPGAGPSGGPAPRGPHATPGRPAPDERVHRRAAAPRGHRPRARRPHRRPPQRGPEHPGPRRPRGPDPRHLTRLFAQCLGEPPGRHVRRIRTETAAHLLRTSSLPVASVATRCGFGTPEALRKAFLERYGVSPSRYRDGARTEAEVEAAGADAD